jgi:hypothetical protein
MQFSVLVIVLLAFMAVAYQLGRKRSLATVGGASGVKQLHSLPSYYGFYTALWAGLPALLVAGLWTFFEGSVVISMVIGSLPAEMQNLPPAQLGLLTNDIINLASGNIVSAEVDATMQQAANHLNELRGIGRLAMAVVALSVALGAGSLAWRAIQPKMRARNRVETIVSTLLILSSLIAIVEPAGSAPARPGGRERRLRRDPADRRHLAHLVHRAAGCGADRPDVGNLPVRLCRAQAEGLCQAGARGAGWGAHGGLWLLRCIDPGATDPGSR